MCRSIQGNNESLAANEKPPESSNQALPLSPQQWAPNPALRQQRAAPNRVAPPPPPPPNGPNNRHRLLGAYYAASPRKRRRHRREKKGEKRERKTVRRTCIIYRGGSRAREALILPILWARDTCTRAARLLSVASWLLAACQTSRP